MIWLWVSIFALMFAFILVACELSRTKKILAEVTSVVQVIVNTFITFNNDEEEK